MEDRKDIWAIILAAGDGTRLKSLTTDSQGIIIPKQFCAFKSSKSMLAHALVRAERVVSRDHIVPVVAAQHREWWEPELATLPNDNIVIQPQNRGTAIGILLPLLRIYRKDPDARIIILPSDHYVADESILETALHQAVDGLADNTDRIVLLGITADAPDAEYGWIVPSRVSSMGFHDVVSFVEKPPQIVAEKLMKQGALWNSFILAATATAFLQFYERTYPDILHEFPIDMSGVEIEELYDTLPSVDFSHDILERNSEYLWVLPVPACGWSDLGTPQKIVCLLKGRGA